MAVAAMNHRWRGSMMLMAGMGLDNRRRERKHDQDDRRSQDSHNLLFNHYGSFYHTRPAQTMIPGNTRAAKVEQPWQFIFQPGL
ncbi:hypothetical protein [Bradyrhizobium sp. URHD0069]|uniref:hypothetical protein n=1 Tax=Bradyrhizobium sp. URHD0069 TaxID=1380355 RepID=UPI0012DE0CE2|nr:hypothetical protein [Bradyrhizobium sp. URHD0069]